MSQLLLLAAIALLVLWSALRRSSECDDPFIEPFGEI